MMRVRGWAALGLIGAIALCGCENGNPGTRVGASLDRAGTATGSALSRAANSTGDALGRAGAATGNALHRSGDYVDRKVGGSNDTD